MRRSEGLTLCALALLALVTVVVRPEGGALRLAVFTGFAAATTLLARRPGRRGLGFLRDWLPAGVVIVVFLLLQQVIEAAASWRLGAALAAFDARYLQWLVDAWRSAFGRTAVFTDAVYLAYVSYYLVPLAVAAVAWRRSAADFERTVFALLLGFYLTFLGYLLLPASGPRISPADEAQLLGGGMASQAARDFLRYAETTTLDAFPSGHTAIALIAGVFGSRLLTRRAAAAVWTWAGAIVHKLLSKHHIRPVIQNRSLWKDHQEEMLPGHDGNSNIVYDEAGTVYCYDRVSEPMVRHRMAYIGNEPARETIKYRCPAMHEGWVCPMSATCNAGKKYGRTIRVPRSIDLRRFPAVPRATKKFERLYKGRTAVERVNARLKIFWGADDGNLTGSRRLFALLGVILVVHAAFATLLAMAPRWEGTLGQTKLGAIGPPGGRAPRGREARIPGRADRWFSPPRFLRCARALPQLEPPRACRS